MPTKQLYHKCIKKSRVFLEKVYYIFITKWQTWDGCRVISENGQKSLNMFRKNALAIHRNYKEQTKHKKSIKKFMLSCLLNDNVFLDVIKL